MQLQKMAVSSSFIAHQHPEHFVSYRIIDVKYDGRGERCQQEKITEM